MRLSLKLMQICSSLNFTTLIILWKLAIDTYNFRNKLFFTEYIKINRFGNLQVFLVSLVQYPSRVHYMYRCTDTRLRVQSMRVSNTLVSARVIGNFLRSLTRTRRERWLLFVQCNARRRLVKQPVPKFALGAHEALRLAFEPLLTSRDSRSLVLTFCSANAE